MQNSSSVSLELDLEHYVVPAPSTSANSGLVYAANMTETPRSLTRAGVFPTSDGLSNTLYPYKDNNSLPSELPPGIKVLSWLLILHYFIYFSIMHYGM